MIIKSILDTDLYKLSMGYAVLKHFPRLKVKYKFTDRNKISFPDGFDKDIKSEVENMEQLSLTNDEKNYLSKVCGDFLPPTYIDFLNGYKFDSSELNIWLDKYNKLNIEIQGYWYRTIYWEVPLMALISELYFKKTGQYVDIFSDDVLTNDVEKVWKMNQHNAFFADFGTRRRYSYDNQDKIVKLFNEQGGDNFVGTSNVHLAHKYNIKSIGSLAHELIMTMAAIYGYKMANKMVMDIWLDTYEMNQLGTMLSDTYTTNIFLKSFEYKYASNFNSVRQDSGCPFKFTDKIITFYKSMGIDPMSKTIIFSDGLNIDKAIKIKEYCVGKIKSSFGIGTNLTNDVGVKPLNMVIKIYQVWVNGEWVDAVKLSDDLGKHTGYITEINICKHVLKID
jgi:nicotinate phosphoribosyltransferase